jgi:hypothetical protein
MGIVKQVQAEENHLKTFLMDGNRTKVIKLPGALKNGEMALLKNELLGVDQYDEILVDLADADCLEGRLVDLFSKLRTERPGHYRRIKILNPRESMRRLLEIRNIDQVYEIRDIYPTSW